MPRRSNFDFKVKGTIFSRKTLESAKKLEILLVNQIHHDLHHHVLFLRLALGNHQSQGDERVVCQAFRAVFAIEDAVVVEKPQEQRGGNALVAVESLIDLSSLTA